MRNIEFITAGSLLGDSAPRMQMMSVGWVVSKRESKRLRVFHHLQSNPPIELCSFKSKMDQIEDWRFAPVSSFLQLITDRFSG